MARRSTIRAFVGLALALTASALVIDPTDPSSLGQLEAMQELKLGFEGSKPSALATWTTSDPCDGTWVGVTCARPGVITRLDLCDMGIAGALSPFIGNLTGLLQLRLCNNQIAGQIPPELGKLYSVQEVELQNNKFTGELPTELGGMATCTHLYLFGNNLSGAIPAALKAVTYLKLGPGNRFCSTVPGSLCAGASAEPLPATPAPVEDPADEAGSLPPLITAPLPNCPPCAGDDLPGLEDGCTCAKPSLLKIRFKDLDFAAYNANQEDVLLGELSRALQLEPRQLMVIGREPGSVILYLAVLPVNGSALDARQEAKIVDAVTGHRVILSKAFKDYEVLGAPGLAFKPSQESQNADAESSSASSGASSGLSTGAIIGIVVASLAAALVIAALFCQLLTWRRDRNAARRADVENSRMAKVLTGSIEAPYRPHGKNSIWGRWDLPRGSPFPPVKPSISGGNSFNEPALSFRSGIPGTPAGAHANGCGDSVAGTPRDTPGVSERSFAFQGASSPTSPSNTAGLCGGDNGDDPRTPEIGTTRTVGDAEGGGTPQEVMEIKKIGLKDIHAATQGYSKANLIGDRGHGRMYKADFSSKARVQMAVLLELSGEKLDEAEFAAAVKALGDLCVQSNRLVAIMAYCADKGQRWVAYEYLPGGSLKDHLHGDLRFERALTWQKRVQIAVDVAAALEFLHEQCEPLVIHRDVSADNVVLDGELRAKIKDVGIHTLVRDWSEGRAVSPSVLGSMGYQAPEFRVSGEQTARSDVFSFGVVLLELLTGRKPVDSSRPKGQQSLLTWVLPHLENRLAVTSLVDPYLRLNSTLDPKSLHLFALVAAHCLQHEPEDRPRMAEVHSQLQHLLLSLSPDGLPSPISPNAASASPLSPASPASPMSPIPNLTAASPCTHAPSPDAENESCSVADSGTTSGTHVSHSARRYDQKRWVQVTPGPNTAVKTHASAVTPAADAAAGVANVRSPLAPVINL
ncbi:unnamed protein product [Closterium sp. NIES-64]|nr:unnamed protein product [Closterium sp. NIES-65]CAI6000428.1 unnamed protein product [Closterium sp. NIES-65]CAI6002232.1 unnamed protein product [Closterium sp. NIES-64]